MNNADATHEEGFGTLEDLSRAHGKCPPPTHQEKSHSRAGAALIARAAPPDPIDLMFGEKTTSYHCRCGGLTSRLGVLRVRNVRASKALATAIARHADIHKACGVWGDSLTTMPPTLLVDQLTCRPKYGCDDTV